MFVVSVFITDGSLCRCLGQGKTAVLLLSSCKFTTFSLITAFYSLIICFTPFIARNFFIRIFSFVLSSTLISRFPLNSPS